MRLVAFALTIFLALAAASCDSDGGGSSARVVDGKITIPHDAVSLERFEFTTRLDVEAADGDYSLTFDGAFQKPDRVQGTLRLEGKFLEDYAWLQRPLEEAEIANINTNAWWRAPGCDWQPGIPKGYESSDPLIGFRQYATPYFYLDALFFDTLSLPASAGTEDINGIRSIPVTLDKQAIIDVLRHGGEVNMYPDSTHEPIASPRPAEGLIDNVEQVVPANFEVSVWFAEGDLHPTRIVFEYDITEDDYSTLSFGFQDPLHLRLQMDITDQVSDLEIDPPIPIVEPTPTPTTPPGATIPVLSEDQKTRIKEIALQEPRLQALLRDRPYTVSEVGLWHTSNLLIIGGVLQFTFDELQTIEADWLVTDRNGSGGDRVDQHYRAEKIEQLNVLVDLNRQQVVTIEPYGQDVKIANSTPPPAPTLAGCPTP
jgi:hypothetical protein